MKFPKITSAAFLALALAANPLLVAAYEVPSDNLIAELADEYESTKESSTFRLRGSSSNDEELESAATDVVDVDWEKMLCKANQRAAVWKTRMGEFTGQAKENAKEHYLEAKAAALRAKAHITPAAKSAWEKAKETSSSVVERARNWFKRHIGDGSTYDGEDEFDVDVQC